MTFNRTQIFHQVIGNFSSVNAQELEQITDTLRPNPTDVETFSRDLFLGKIDISHLPLARHQQDAELDPVDLRDAKNCALILAEFVVPNSPNRNQIITNVNILFNRGLLPLHSLICIPLVMERVSRATALSAQKVSELAAQVEQMDQVIRALTIPELFSFYTTEKAAKLLPGKQEAKNVEVARTRSPQSTTTQNSQPKRIKATPSPEKTAAKRAERLRRKQERERDAAAAIEKAKLELLELAETTALLKEKALNQFQTNRTALGVEGENFIHRFLSTPISFFDEMKPKFHTQLLCLAELEKNHQYLQLLEDIVNRYISENFFDPQKVESLKTIVNQHRLITDNILELYDLGVVFKPMADKVILAEEDLVRKGLIRNVEKEWKEVLNAPFAERTVELEIPATNCEWSRERINSYLLGVPEIVLKHANTFRFHWIGDHLQGALSRPNQIAQHNNPVDHAGQYWLSQCSTNEILVRGGSDKKTKISMPRSVVREHHFLSGREQNQLTRCLDIVFRN